LVCPQHSCFPTVCPSKCAQCLTDTEEFSCETGCQQEPSCECIIVWPCSAVLLCLCMFRFTWAQITGPEQTPTLTTYPKETQSCCYGSKNVVTCNIACSWQTNVCDLCAEGDLHTNLVVLPKLTRCCPVAGFFGPPDCDPVPECRNNGTLNEPVDGTCVCTEGFSGR
jgi:hypothetical protein